MDLDMTQTPIRVVITGAQGRMGQALIHSISLNPKFQLTGSFEKGSTVSEIEALYKSTDVIIDFSSPEASVQFAKLAAIHKVVHVIGTTGFSEANELEIEEAAEKTIIIKSGNFSIGVNVLAAVTERVAKTLESIYDIEVLEMHHKHKVDAPSGTALLLGQAAAAGRGVNLKDVAVYERFGHTGARVEGDIGFATLRGGSVIGDHTVMFAGPFERVELSHKAESRMIFADGALAAAAWGVKKQAGLYSMRDVLEI